MINLSFNSLHRPQGFTLAEVMAAVLVIAIGILGLAKMDAVSVSESGTSSTRALVANAVSSLGGAMKANEMYWQTTSVPTSITIAGGSGGLAVTTPAALTPGQIPKSQCLNAVCTPVQMAAADLSTFATSLKNLVPTASSTITCSQASGTTQPATCQISVSWTEHQVALNQSIHSAIQNSTTSTETFTQVVQP